MTLEFLIASAIGVLVAGGIYLILRARLFAVVLGLTLFSYAVNLFLFASGRLVVDAPPIWSYDVDTYTDPLPQALVLTAIVITFGMTAFVVILALRSFLETAGRAADAAPPCCRSGGKLRVLRCRAWRGDRAARPVGRRYGQDLRGGRLARAVRHRARSGSPVRHHADADGGAGADRAGARHRHSGRSGRLAFPSAVPVPADGIERRVPDRRPVQSVRVLRSAADRVLRPDAARAGACAVEGRGPVRRRQSRRIVDLPARIGPALCADGYAEHGGYGRSHSGYRGRRSMAAAHCRAAAVRRLRDQGGDRAAASVAPAHLCRRNARRRRPVRHHDQDRRLFHHQGHAADLRRRCRSGRLGARALCSRPAAFPNRRPMRSSAPPAR